MKYSTKNFPRPVKVAIICILSLTFIAWLDPYRDRVSDGNSSFHQKKYKDARRYYKKAEKYAPTEKDKKKLSFNKGGASYMLNDYDNAITLYQRAIQADDKDVQKKGFFNLGNTYLQQGKYKEAVNAYINALKIDPKYGPAKKNLEYLLKNKKDKDDKKKNKKDNKDGKDKKKKKDKQQDKNKQNKDRNRQEKRKQTGSMSKEQIRNILKSMKQKPVKRRKGSPDEKRTREKYW